MELSKNEVEQLLARQADRVTKESDKRMKDYIGALKEDSDHKLAAIMEYVKDVPAIKEKQDVMFDKIGDMATDVVVIKDTVQNHERRLQRLEL
jgi:hypothetical protein